VRTTPDPKSGLVEFRFSFWVWALASIGTPCVRWRRHDMAAQWRSLAANVESSERLLQDVPANDVGEAYRFGSRIQTKGQEP
jgi:hypothetical protein